jgi:predicted nucleic acid-binding protein
MYLVDTDVISNARKRTRANPGVRRFFRDAATQRIPLFLLAVTIGELLRVPHAENPLDKQIAATALIYGLTVVTRNVSHYEPTGVAVLNPFT